MEPPRGYLQRGGKGIRKGGEEWRGEIKLEDGFLWVCSYCLCAYLNLPLVIGVNPVPRNVTTLATPLCRALEGRMVSI